MLILKRGGYKWSSRQNANRQRNAMSKTQREAHITYEKN